jgi:Cu(I)/Ag(I) efflux system protein CusF
LGANPHKVNAKACSRVYGEEVILDTLVSDKEPHVKKSWIATTASLVMGLALSVSALAQPVDGEVRKIDADAGKITLKHGEIKNLDLPAMQMAFRVANPAWLKSVQVGDKVTFSADKVGGQFTITAIDVKK